MQSSTYVNSWSLSQIYESWYICVKIFSLSFAQEYVYIVDVLL